MELIKITVTKKDIENGTTKSCFDCPISIAICRDAKISYRNVSVANTIRISGCLQHIEIPKWLKGWIIEFDKGKDSLPFEFYILKRKMPMAWEILHDDISIYKKKLPNGKDNKRDTTKANGAK